MRHLIAGLTVLLFSAALASAQQRKPVQLADYVSFCLALWADAPDIEAEASALGLQHTADHVTIGKSTVQVYGAGPGNQGVVAVTTILADGKDLYCDVSVPGTMVRADLETMEQTLHLDGQIIATSATVAGHWKMPDQQPPMLLKAFISRSGLALAAEQFKPD
jgi:hypothetical protein